MVKPFVEVRLRNLENDSIVEMSVHIHHDFITSYGNHIYDRKEVRPANQLLKGMFVYQHMIEPICSIDRYAVENVKIRDGFNDFAERVKNNAQQIQ